MKKENFNNDLTKIIKKIHEGKWIALSPDQTKVIAFSESLEALCKKVGNKEVVYMRVPLPGVAFAF